MPHFQIKIWLAQSWRLLLEVLPFSESRGEINQHSWLVFNSACLTFVSLLQKTLAVVSRPDKHRLQLNSLWLPPHSEVCCFAFRKACLHTHTLTHTDADTALTCLRSLIEHVGRCVTGTIHLAICFSVLHGQILPPQSCNQGQDEIQVPLWGRS